MKRPREIVRLILTQGLTPRALARCVVAGVAFSVFPIMGTTTVLCAAVAAAGRLNQVAIQGVNWLVAPLHVMLIIPLMRLGERVWGAPPLPLASDELIALVRADAMGFARRFGMTLVHAVSGWALTVLPLAVLLWLATRGLSDSPTGSGKDL